MGNIHEPLSADDVKLIRSALLLKKLAMVQEAGFHTCNDNLIRIYRLLRIMDEILKEE